MSKLRKNELRDCQQLMKGANSLAVLAADCINPHQTRVLIEDSELDKEISDMYSQAVAELRQAFRTLSLVEEKIQPAAVGRQILGGIFSRA
tara:strand:- start:54 stop:326 length:273 start_codon:yes stop_codon:yes gene_type:complete